MNPNHYPPINVLCIIWGEDQGGRIGRIQPIRLERENGQVYRVKEVRQHVRIREGRSYQHQFNVFTKEGSYLEIWLDMQTMTWCLTEEHDIDGITHNYCRDYSG